MTFVNSKDQPKSDMTLVATLFWAWGAIFLARMSGLYLSPFITPEFHLTRAQVGMLGSALALSWAFSGLILGSLSDRIGRTKILIPCLLFSAVLCAACGLARNFPQLLLLRVLLGVAEGPAWPILNAMVKDSSSEATRGRNVGIVVSAAALVGLAAAPLLATQVASRVGWRWGFFAASVPALVAGLLVLAYVREPERYNQAEMRRSGKILNFMEVLRHRNVWLSCIGTTGFMCWLFITHAFAPLYITEVAHQTATTAGFLIAATGLGSFFSGLILPALSDKIGRERGLRIMTCLSAVVPLALLVPYLYSHLWLLGAILFVANAGQGVSALIMVLIPSEAVGPEYAGTAIALAVFVGEIVGATLLPLLSGKLAQTYGLGITMWIAAAGMILVFLLTYVMRGVEPWREKLLETRATL
jgi:predicted MFS family arabinose efflux permease